MMTLSTGSVTLEGLRSISDRGSLLFALKDLKNSVIGNSWKKVEVAGDDGLKDFLLNQLSCRPLSDQIDLDIINETSVIIGALASDGPLTLRPLVLAQAPTTLIELVRALDQTFISKSQQTKVLSSVLRALRNILVSAADLVWGHQWGVGAERKVVGTGLIGLSQGEENGKGKGVEGTDDVWRLEATNALTSVFEPSNLSTLLLVLQSHTSPQVLVPVYQLLARLIVLPSHREALATWSPASTDHEFSQAGPSTSRFAESGASIFRPTSSPPTSLPFILKHLVDMISQPGSVVRRSTPKALEAALDLLAALIKGQSTCAGMLRSWTSKSEDTVSFESARSSKSPLPSLYSPSPDREARIPEFFALLQDLLATSSTPVRIAAASCLAHLLKAERHTRPTAHTRINLRLLATVTELLETEPLEEKVKLCFVMAIAVADEPELSKVAAEQGCTQQIIALLDTVEKADRAGTISRDLAYRGREGSLVALAALAFPLDSIRIMVTEADPPCLPYILDALSHSSFGVRSAACQLTRALSRTVSLVRTSLIDCGISDEVINTLIREVSDRNQRARQVDQEGPWDERGLEGTWGDRSYTVEITAMMTLCNLITDFSPLKEKLLAGPGIDTICDLTHSPNEELAMNALWTIKNAMFKSTETMKARILSVLGVDHLKRLIASTTPPVLRTQAMGIVQNFLADGALSDLMKGVELLGEVNLVEAVASAMSGGTELELRAKAFGVLVNLSWGNKELRSNLTSRPSLVESVSQGLDSKHDEIKQPALRVLRNLILIPTTRPGRPRQAMLDVFQPYNLKARARDLAENSASLEVTVEATHLLELLERARAPTDALREDVLDR